MLFLVEVVPRSEEDIRISVAIEAIDRLDALRRGLAEIGLDGGWVGSASVVPVGDGALRVTAPDRGLSFVVRLSDDQPSEASTPSLDLLQPPHAVTASGPVASVAEAPVVETDDAVLDLSRLELYFADEEEVDEVVAPLEAERAPAPEVAATVVACVDAPSAMPADGQRRMRDVLGRLGDLEDHVYDLSGAMELAAQVLLAPLCADVACVLLVDRRGKALGFAGLAGDAPTRLAKYRYPKGLGLPWLAFDERRALLVNGIDRDLGLHREVQEKTGFRIRATILAPIVSEGRAWGVVQAVRSAVDASDFVDGDLVVLEAAARRLGAYLALFGTHL